LVKYSPSRDVIWVKSDLIADVRVVADPSGVEYLYEFGSAIRKLDLDGNVVWSTPTSPSLSSIAIDTDGAIYGSGPGILLSKWAAGGTSHWSGTTGGGGRVAS